MYDPRNNLANEVSNQLLAHFGDTVFRTVIPRNIRLAEAPSFGKPALFHDKESRGALAYLALAGEMIRREEVADHGSSVRPPPPALTGAAAATNGHGTGAAYGAPVSAATPGTEAAAGSTLVKDH
jgi:hypothetical protein